MIQTRTASEILRDGHALAVRYAAPLESQTRLLQAAHAVAHNQQLPLPVTAIKVRVLPVLVESEAE